jgi:hypothetical protein
MEENPLLAAECYNVWSPYNSFQAANGCSTRWLMYNQRLRHCAMCFESHLA